jgi:hypothetical protein
VIRCGRTRSFQGTSPIRCRAVCFLALQGCPIFLRIGEHLDRAVQLSSPEELKDEEESQCAGEYRAKAFDCLSRAQSIDDPEQRADMLRLARMWMSLSEPLGDIPGAYEYPPQDQRSGSRHR